MYPTHIAMASFGLFASEVHFGNPIFWAYAYEDIQTLCPDRIVDPSILDFCISSGVLRRSHATKAYYLDQVIIQDLTSQKMVSDKVRDIIAPSTTGTLPMLPVLFLHRPEIGYPYYLICLNFSSAQVLVLDRESRETENGTPVSWDRWGGSIVWARFALAFGWTVENTPVIKEIDWVEVSGLVQYCLVTTHVTAKPAWHELWT